MKKLILSVFLIVAAGHGAFQAMNVAVFLQKADALEKKGMTAMFSSDLGCSSARSGPPRRSFKAERDAARRAGRPPLIVRRPKRRSTATS